MEIENITFLEYTNLKDKSLYDYAAQFSRKLNTAKDLFDIGDFTKLTFGQVKDAQYLFSSGVSFEKMFKFVSQVTKDPYNKIAKQRFFDLCMCRRFVEEQLQEIHKLELNIYHETDARDESAGIDRLAKFGVLIQIDSLAGGDVLKYDLIKELPYNLCFTKLLMQKEIDLFNLNKSRQKKQ